MANEKYAEKFLVYGEDAELAKMLTSKLKEGLSNRRISYLRKIAVRKKHECSFEENAEYLEHIFMNEPSFEESVEAKLLREAIRQYLYKLTPRECEVIICLYIRHMTAQETAAILNLEKNTISTHKKNATDKIRAAMEEN